ncbi:MAG: hypothetical protein R2795_00095 [Saprospiraceae bacterium]
MKNLAVIDCGTNTFHLLIARPSETGFKEVHRERRFIKLAEAGIAKIGDAAYARALQTLQDFAVLLQQHAVETVRVSGTAALRTASNGPAFVAEVKAKTGLSIDLISGKEEAQLIYKGVRQAIGPQQGRWMVMDIGGGSVEFIIVDEEGVRWFESFPVGVAVLFRQLHKSDPINAEEIEATRLFLNSQLVELQLVLAKYPLTHLVGAAGTFDVLAASLGTHQATPYCTQVELEGFMAFYQKIVAATQAERHAMPDVPDDRADMIVVALILVQFVLEKAGIKHLTVSDYSMKEGMLAEMLEE